jgi:hypothetical protein
LELESGDGSPRGKLFSWGGLYWVFLVLMVYLLNYLTRDALKNYGIMDSERVLMNGGGAYRYGDFPPCRCRPPGQ